MRVLIAGAGGLGREVLATVLAIAAAGTDIGCYGFLVDPHYESPSNIHGFPVYRDLGPLHEDPELEVVVALGDPASRRRAAHRLEAAVSPRFATVLHPALSVGTNVTIGAGTMAVGPASVTADVRIGRHVLINPLVSVSHDCCLADFVTLGPSVALAGGVGIEEGAELGVGACVIPRQTVGAWSLVGAGCTVIRPVAPNATVIGLPARQIAARPQGWHTDL